MNDNNVIPLARKPKNGLKLKVNAHLTNDQGVKTNYIADFWIRKDEVVQVLDLGNHPSIDHKCNVVLKGGGVVQTMDNFESIISRLDRGEE